MSSPSNHESYAESAGCVFGEWGTLANGPSPANTLGLIFAGSECGHKPKVSRFNHFVPFLCRPVSSHPLRKRPLTPLET